MDPLSPGDRGAILRANAERAEENRKRRESAWAAQPKHLPPPDRYADPNDPYELRQRFCVMQKDVFDQALSEIRSGKKEGCWSWYVFPAPPFVENGIEQGSSASRRYALRDGDDTFDGVAAARAFLQFQEVDGVCLRSNYMVMMSAVGDQLEAGVPPARLVGVLDIPKVRASLQLFERASKGEFDPEVNRVCARALMGLKKFELQD